MQSQPTAETGPLRYPRRWPPFLDKMVTIAVLPGDEPDTVRTKRIFTAALWVSLLTAGVGIYQFVQLEAPLAAVALAVPWGASLGCIVAMWVRPTSYPGVMHWVAAATQATSVTMIILLGGVYESAGSATWGVVVIIGAAAVFGDRRAHFWLAVFVVTTVGATFVAAGVGPTYVLPDSEFLSAFNLIAIGVLIYGVLYYFVRKSDILFRQSEGLLRNILPEKIVQRLKVSDEAIADQFDATSILFADVAGFTPMAAQLDPEELIDLLNEIFSAFDEIVDRYGLEKIKTIGDAYMVAAGVPLPRDDHARVICDLALDMQSLLGTRTFGGKSLSMRIGVASGPVTAGIIGRRKFSYDLWGDTVNLASRMESFGTPGQIQMPATMRELVEPWFTCERRGVIEVKGLGQIETWYLLGREPS